MKLRFVCSLQHRCILSCSGSVYKKSLEEHIEHGRMLCFKFSTQAISLNGKKYVLGSKRIELFANSWNLNAELRIDVIAFATNQSGYGNPVCNTSHAFHHVSLSSLLIFSSASQFMKVMTVYIQKSLMSLLSLRFFLSC